MKITIVAAGFVALTAKAAFAATAVATYQFNSNFNADESGPPALTATDPLGTSTFTTDTVFGSPRTVWAFSGAASPATNQAGVTANTTGLVNPGSYSVDMVVKLTAGTGAWRRLIDVQNRQSDNGFYVDPSNNLDVFPVSGSSAAWSTNVYHHIVLTDNGTSVIAYLDGLSQFTSTTTIMNLDFDPVNNPNKLMGFFLDNVAAGGQGEWSPGDVALIRLWDGVLTAQEAQTLATNPFASTVPEPASLGVLMIGACGLLARRRR